jgi:hypothetical protein
MQGRSADQPEQGALVEWPQDVPLEVSRVEGQLPAMGCLVRTPGILTGYPGGLGGLEEMMRNHWAKIAVLLLLIAGTASAADSQMQPFVSAEGRFSVLMPGTVQSGQKLHQFKDGKTAPEYRFWVTQDHGNVAYMVMYSDIPAGAPGDKAPQVLEKIRDAIVAGKTVLADSPIELNGVPGRAIKVKLPDGLIVEAHEFLAGSRQYQLLVSSSEGHPATQIDQFMNSFKIH